jgi:CO dehydrogenase nickel-insertion accessory protein CooC1
MVTEGDQPAGALPGPSVSDLFISYTETDRAWAEWIGWQLEEAGYRVFLQAWDSTAGAHAVADVHRAASTMARTVAVLSGAYLISAYRAAEWQAAWASDPTGADRRLVAVRVEDCPMPGLLGQLVGVDLFGLDHGTARERLLAAVTPSRAKPATAPTFPGTSNSSVPSISGRPPTLNGIEPRLPGEPAVWRMRGRFRNPNFVGRDHILKEIRSNLHATSGVKVQALQGMGGIGKSAIAAEYAHRYQADYDVVCWISAEESSLIDTQILDALDLLIERRDSIRQTRVEDILDLLNRKERTLLIFDNAAGPNFLRPYLPGGKCHVLVTSRSRGWDEIGAQAEVQLFNRAESVALLGRRLPDTIPSPITEALAAELGDLPLAVTQAIGYMRRTQTSPGEYLKSFHLRRRFLLAKFEPADYPATLATTWNLAFLYLRQFCQPAIKILEVATFLAPEPIPLTLLRPQAWSEENAIAENSSDFEGFNDAIDTLVDLALIDKLDDGRVLIHRMIRASVRNSMTEEDRQRSLHAARAALAGHDTAGLDLLAHELATGIWFRLSYDRGPSSGEPAQEGVPSAAPSRDSFDRLKRGQVVTFYSYKGGIGRTMALANIAWILASNGMKILVADWDLECPGVHRYFLPFLDQGLWSTTSGFVEMASRYLPEVGSEVSAPSLRQEIMLEQVPTVPVNFEFPEGGSLDLLPAGRIDDSYVSRVSSLDWQKLYEGPTFPDFLDALRARLKAQYDYVLIDSRTGLADNVDIGTTHMPDILVSCFTLNRQSVAVTAAVSRHVAEFNRHRGVRILPVPMRVDAENSHRMPNAKRAFDPYPNDLNDPNMASHYWDIVKVPYDPSYAYEEKLAEDRDGSRSESLRNAYESISTAIVNDENRKSL